MSAANRSPATRPPAARGEPGTAPETPRAPAGRDARRPRRARRHRPRTAESPGQPQAPRPSPALAPAEPGGAEPQAGAGSPRGSLDLFLAGRPAPTYLPFRCARRSARSLRRSTPELATRPGAEPAVAFSQLSERDPPPPGGPSERPAPDLRGCPYLGFFGVLQIATRALQHFRPFISLLLSAR